MTEKIRNFKPFFLFFAIFLILTSFLSYYDLPIFCEIFIALIAKELYAVSCFLVLLKKNY